MSIPNPNPNPPHPGEMGYAALVNSLGGIVWEADGRTFRFSFVSPQAERILGYPARRWLDEPDFWRAHTHPDDVGWCSAYCFDATSHGRDHEFEYRMIAADGRVVWLRDVVTVVRGNDGSLRLRGIMLDVSERKRLEEELCQSQKMEAVGRLAGGVAHDFNNLLTVIGGYSDLLMSALPAGHPARGMAEQVRSAGERASALTRQLLEFGRRSVVAPRPVDLNVLVSGLDNILRRVIGEDVRLTADLAPNLWAVRADPGQIEQVIMNLCVNARDAMPRGGALTVSTRNLVLDDEYARTRPDARTGEHVVLSVSDTGSGIPSGVLPRVFEPFFTTKTHGTGLGLSTVYGVVRQACGHVAVESEVGRGTEFRVYLPRSDGSPAPDSSAVRSASPPGRETVLLVEDDEAVRSLVRAVLEVRGYTVLAASDGREAVALGRSFAGRIDLVVTDVVMPELGGREAAEELTRMRPELKVLFVSGYTDDAVVRHGVREAEVAFLQKPFTPAALAARVREVLDGG
jgi:PAS domain S-box-containing protein